MQKQIIKPFNQRATKRKTWMLYHKESLELKVVKEFVDYVKELDFMVDI